MFELGNINLDNKKDTTVYQTTSQLLKYYCLARLNFYISYSDNCKISNEFCINLISIQFLAEPKQILVVFVVQGMNYPLKIKIYDFNISTCF